MGEGCGLYLSGLRFSVREVSPRGSNSNAPINVMPEEGGTTGQGGDFDQKQKFGVKLPNPWDKISVQSSPPWGRF